MSETTKVKLPQWVQEHPMYRRIAEREAYIKGVEQTSENRAQALMMWEKSSQDYLDRVNELEAEKASGLWEIAAANLRSERLAEQLESARTRISELEGTSK